MNDELRPERLQNFIGNDKIKKCLEINIIAAKKLNKAISHILFLAKSGSGKTTLAKIIGNELGVNMHIVNCANLQKIKELYPILFGAKDKDIIFLDEVHRLSKHISDLMLSILEGGEITIPGLKETRKFSIPDISIIAATTAPNRLDEPFRNRFINTYTLEDYNLEEMIKILQMNMHKVNLNLDYESCTFVAKTSKMVPRIINSRLLWLRDYKIANNIKNLTTNDIRVALDMSGIDEDGLDQQDQAYLKLLEDADAPLSLKTISDKLHISTDYVEYIEQNLIRLDKIEKTGQGRVIKGRSFSNGLPPLKKLSKNDKDELDKIMESIPLKLVG